MPRCRIFLEQSEKLRDFLWQSYEKSREIKRIERVSLSCYVKEMLKNLVVPSNNCTFALDYKIFSYMEIKTIGIASDHAGFALKQFVKKYLEEKGYEYKDYGTYTEDSCDYSDFGHALARGIEQGEVFPGIAICGSGEGINMTLNKHQSIRAGLCWIPEIAHLIRQHNNANVLVMPGRFIDEDMARKIMDEYFSTEFEGGRHQKRIDKIPV